MHLTHLRKVGGSVMLAVPPAILDLLRLRAGLAVGLAVDQGRLVVQPTPRQRYQLEDLLASCDSSAAITQQEQAWVAMKPAVTEGL